VLMLLLEKAEEVLYSALLPGALTRPSVIQKTQVGADPEMTSQMEVGR
jgi:hypothetical protein